VSNLTVAIDDAVLRRAVRGHTTVNGMARDFVNRYAGADETEQPMAWLLALAGNSPASSGPHWRTWT
jgi:hypothetical protein